MRMTTKATEMNPKKYKGKKKGSARKEQMRAREKEKTQMMNDRSQLDLKHFPKLRQAR